MLITPQVIEKAATDIVEFWEQSELPETDKAKILTMIKDYYNDKNDYVYEQYLAQLTQRTIDRRVPQTKFDDV